MKGRDREALETVVEKLLQSGGKITVGAVWKQQDYEAAGDEVEELEDEDWVDEICYWEATSGRKMKIVPADF
jgi:hypothetical protein